MAFRSVIKWAVYKKTKVRWATHFIFYYVGDKCVDYDMGIFN